MMKLYFTLSKKNLAVALATIIIMLLLLSQFLSVNAGGIDGSTNAKRVNFLETLGIEVDETAVEIKDITIPENFGDVYEKYNLLQIENGFNLKNYKGKSAKVYTYAVQGDGETVAHLIICSDEIIGGDIASLKIDGNMTGLQRKINERTKI